MRDEHGEKNAEGRRLPKVFTFSLLSQASHPNCLPQLDYSAKMEIQKSPAIAHDDEPRRYKPEKWEAKKGLIEQCYVVKGRKLEEVIDILKQRSGFIAT